MLTKMKVSLSFVVALSSWGAVSGFIGTGVSPKFNPFLEVMILQKSSLNLPISRDVIPLVPPLFSKTELQASTVAGGDHHGNILQQWASNVSQTLSRLSWNIRHDEITQWRCAALAFVASIAIFHQRIDLALVKLWNYLSISNGLWARAFRHDRTFGKINAE